MQNRPACWTPSSGGSGAANGRNGVELDDDNDALDWCTHSDSVTIQTVLDLFGNDAVEFASLARTATLDNRSAPFGSGLDEEARRRSPLLDGLRNLLRACLDPEVLECVQDLIAAHVAFEERLKLVRGRSETHAMTSHREACAEPGVATGQGSERTLRLVGTGAAFKAQATAIPNTRDRTETDRLTARERQVATHLAQGLSNRQIAAELIISERTVAHHVEHILTKLGAPSRAAAAAYAERTGLTTAASARRLVQA